MLFAIALPVELLRVARRCFNQTQWCQTTNELRDKEIRSKTVLRLARPKMVFSSPLLPPSQWATTMNSPHLAGDSPFRQD